MKTITTCSIMLMLIGCPFPEPPIPGPTPEPTAVISPIPTDIPMPTPPPIASITPGVPEGGFLICTGPQRAPDGPGGFLWKNGDMTKKIAVILPGKFKKADKVVVTGKKGKTENLYFAGFGNPDPAGDRQHWRGSKPVAAYIGKVEAFTGNDACVWVFKNASRVD